MSVALEASESFGPLELRSFPWEQPTTREALAERVASISFIASLPLAERQELLAQATALADGLSEPFPFRYRSDVYVCERL